MQAELASAPLLARVRSHAYGQLRPRERQRSTLDVGERIQHRGTVLGPDFQKAVVDRPSVVVFADDVPGANFAHACRYFLYDAANGEMYAKYAAQFPPYLAGARHLWQRFHDPIGAGARRNYRYTNDAPALLRRSMAVPQTSSGRRYAILLAGMPDISHINDIEFCYRVLTQHFGFQADDVAVLNSQGGLTTWEGDEPTVWPGDGTPFTLTVRGPGTQAAVQEVLSGWKPNLRRNDLLFVMTTGHGGNHGFSDGESYLCEAADGFGREYTAEELGEDLKQLPEYRALVVVMQQCFADGMSGQIRANATASSVSIAAACRSDQYSHALLNNPEWNSFSWHWLCAQLGVQPDGLDLESNPDTDGSQQVEADEAFAFARDASTAHPDEDPVFTGGAAGGSITLT